MRVLFPKFCLTTPFSKYLPEYLVIVPTMELWLYLDVMRGGVMDLAPSNIRF